MELLYVDEKERRRYNKNKRIWSTTASGFKQKNIYNITEIVKQLLDVILNKCQSIVNHNTY